MHDSRSPDFSVSLSSNNGSLPPSHRRSWRVTVSAAGQAERTTKHGYGSAGEATTTGRILSESEMVALHHDLDELGLFSTEWSEWEGPRQIGGGITRIRATAGGQSVEIPARVAAEQRGLRSVIAKRIESVV